MIRDVLDHAIGGEPAKCVPSGAITVGRKGEQLAPMAEMAELGVRLFTDDGTGVQDGGLMRRALEYAKGLGVTLAAALRGQPARGGRLDARRRVVVQARHSRPAVVGGDGDGAARPRVVPAHRRADPLPAPVDRGVARRRRASARPRGCRSPPRSRPHHFTLTDACCCDYDATFKVNPPLRTDADVEAVKAALRGGHGRRHRDRSRAARARERRSCPSTRRRPGMLGLETALALALTELDLPIERVLGST